jgi:hypothetical protein
MRLSGEVLAEVDSGDVVLQSLPPDARRSRR